MRWLLRGPRKIAEAPLRISAGTSAVASRARQGRSASCRSAGSPIPTRLRFFPVRLGIGADDPADVAHHARPERVHEHRVGPRVSRQYGLMVAQLACYRGRDSVVSSYHWHASCLRLHLQRILTAYTHYYNQTRTHLLSSDARCNTPPSRFGIGRIETSGSVAMRGYSHLSDDEREQIGLLKVLGYSIGAIARALRRPKSTISRELSRNRLPSGRYSPLHRRSLSIAQAA